MLIPKAKVNFLDRRKILLEVAVLMRFGVFPDILCSQTATRTSVAVNARGRRSVEGEQKY